MAWYPAEDRYEKMIYNRCGNSGLLLPALSLGMWHNFGDDTAHEVKIDICQTAFDAGITHFDLANNYGPPPGSAESAFGEILRTQFNGLRDELVISSKAGYPQWARAPTVTRAAENISSPAVIKASSASAWTM